MNSFAFEWLGEKNPVCRRSLPPPSTEERGTLPDLEERHAQQLDRTETRSAGPLLYKEE